MGSSVIFNMKGVFLLELPGPRLLLMMKANLLIPKPETKGPRACSSRSIDLDIGRGTMTIGLAIDFEVKPLLRSRSRSKPSSTSTTPSDWHLYLGRFMDQIQASVLEVFEGQAT